MKKPYIIISVLIGLFVASIPGALLIKILSEPDFKFSFETYAILAGLGLITVIIFIVTSVLCIGLATVIKKKGQDG